MNPLSTEAGQKPFDGDTKAFLAQTLNDQIQLVAIISDGPTTGKDFGTDAEAASSWSAKENERGRNVYWTVNKVRPCTDKKPLKTDMVGARFAHLDKDPPKDGSFWDSQRALQELNSFSAPPTFVIWSGNGWQALWRLKDAGLDDVELINKALIDHFGGDKGTWNHDRLMRLPGFTNYPNKKKRDAGRVPAKAYIESPDNGTHYTIAQLHEALGINVTLDADGVSGEARKIEIVTSPRRGPIHLLTTADLSIAPGNCLMQLIDQPKGKDRSADTFSCACEMARQGYYHDEVMGVLLNPLNKISAHCLAQSDPQRAAERATNKAFQQESVLVRQKQRERNRQIGEGGREIPAAELFTLGEMLTRFVFIKDGSQVAEKDRPRSRLNFPDFRNATAASIHNMPKPEGGFRPVPCALAWLQDSNRLSAETVTFKAGAGYMTYDPDGREALNLWAPHARSPIPLDWAEHVVPFVEHIKWLWGEYAEQFLDWLAHIEQKPGELPHFGWLHISKKHGMGRGWIASVLVRLWRGNVAASFDLIGALNSSFNDRLSRCLLAIVDEINEGGNSSYRHAQTLRQMITAEHREINPKYGRKHVEHNAARWLIFSNHVGALPLDAHDRRFFVVDHEGPARAAEYYTRLYSLLHNPAFIMAVAEFLRQRDISRFNPGEIPPITTAKQALIASTRSEADTIMEEIVTRWPLDIISWREIASLMGDHVPDGPAVRHMTERAGLMKLKSRIRLPPSAQNATAVYAIRNHAVWTSASKDALRKELSSMDSDEKHRAFYGD